MPLFETFSAGLLEWCDFHCHSIFYIIDPFLLLPWFICCATVAKIAFFRAHNLSGETDDSEIMHAIKSIIICVLGKILSLHVS